MNSDAVILIPSDVFASLDEFHQAAAIVLQRRGRIKITDAPEAPHVN